MVKYIYKVSCYETKRKTISHTNMYFTKLEDCLWIYDTYYNSKNDILDNLYYSDSPPPKLNDFFDIQIVRVREDSDEYSSALHNEKNMAAGAESVLGEQNK
jgi:hypothetical protein